MTDNANAGVVNNLIRGLASAVNLGIYTLLSFMYEIFFNVSSDYILGLINKPLSLDERKKSENNELHIPMEIVKIKAARETYKTFVDYLKYTYKDK